MEPVVSWPGWEFVRRLGAGSYGEVYEIRQQLGPIDRRAALKIIPVPRDESELNELYSLGYDEETVERSLQEQVIDVIREFSVMTELKGHTNIVYCEDIRCLDRPDGRKGKDICMQMELLTPLMLMRKPGEEEAQAVSVGRDLLNALAVCQKKKIVHRDIKPQNIFVSPDGDYKLGDFGVAKTMDRTGSATMIGTLNYMAPEVHSGAHYGSSADVYSLGLVLYWLLNERRLPFVPILARPAKQSEVEQAMSRRLRGEALPFPKHGSVELRRLVCSMCAYRPEDRPSVEALRAAFDRLANPSGTRQQPQPKPQPAPVKPKPAPAPIAEDEEEEEGTLGVWETKRPPQITTPPAQKPAPKAPPRETPPPKPAPERTPEPAPKPAPEPEKEYNQRNAAAIAAKEEAAKAEAARATQTAKILPNRTDRIIAVVIAAFIALLALGFFTIHVYEPATCTSPKICKICGRSSGEALGHRHGDVATCTTTQVCTRCGATLKDALGHNWTDATYDAPKTCRRCGSTAGDPKGYHTWNEIEEMCSIDDESSEDIVTFGDYSCYYTVLKNTAIQGCFRMTVKFGFAEVKQGYPYGTMYLYVRDLNGNWKQVGSFQTDESALAGEWDKVKSYTVDFSSDTDFDAYTVVTPDPNARFSYWLRLDSYQTRED